jgi:hypothetical protein
MHRHRADGNPPPVRCHRMPTLERPVFYSHRRVVNRDRIIIAMGTGKTRRDAERDCGTLPQEP